MTTWMDLRDIDVRELGLPERRSLPSDLWLQIEEDDRNVDGALKFGSLVRVSAHGWLELRGARRRPPPRDREYVVRVQYYVIGLPQREDWAPPGAVFHLPADTYARLPECPDWRRW